MTAIHTSIIPATNTLPTRIKASAPAQGIRRELTRSINELEQICEMCGQKPTKANVHRLAATLLCTQYKWKDSETLVGGVLVEDYVWVFPSQNPPIQKL